MNDHNPYGGREQTLVKHFILRKYLERFAHIIGSRWNGITYVDCFSGPWSVRSDSFSDSSFAIALDQLRKARATHEQRGKQLKLRCLFLEKNPHAYAKLAAFAERVKDVEIRTLNRALEEAVADILQFIHSGGRQSFPFIFVDPTGWTGFSMNLIAPLLCVTPGEVLINFMTDFIRRFFGTQQSFEALFGSPENNPSLQTLLQLHQQKMIDRAGGIEDRIEMDVEELLLDAYATSVRLTGNFKHVCTASILYPEIDRTFFHLVYATRDRKGIEVFKAVEKQAMPVMETSRAEAKERARVRKTRQPGLFAPEFMPHSEPTKVLRERYLREAEERVLAILQAKRRVPYEEVWDAALSFRLVWESDLKDWIREWGKRRLVTITGLEPRHHVPKLDSGNTLLWQSS